MQLQHRLDLADFDDRDRVLQGRGVFGICQSRIRIERFPDLAGDCRPGEYTDRKGDAIEDIIRAKLDLIQQQYGIPHSKGQVRLVGKEVDHVVPSMNEPYVMIMTSYMETTSSSQTARANEQSEMYGIIQADNRRYGTGRVLVNFVDGAGWLARRSDLRKLHAGCDYIINLNTLDQLEAIICQYVPENYFTKSPRPQVEG